MEATLDTRMIPGAEKEELVYLSSSRSASLALQIIESVFLNSIFVIIKYSDQTFDPVTMALGLFSHRFSVKAMVVIGFVVI